MLLGEHVHAAPPNILFIPVDDLNHWVGHLGMHPQARTPHLDRFAAQGVSFTTSLLRCSGLQSIANCTDVRNAASHDRLLRQRSGLAADYSEDKLLNHTLLSAGYEVYGAGKVLHGSYGNGQKWTEFFSKSGGGQSLRRHPSREESGSWAESSFFRSTLKIKICRTIARSLRS